MALGSPNPNTIHVIPTPQGSDAHPRDQISSERFPQIPNEEKAGQRSQQTSSPAHHQEIHVLAQFLSSLEQRIVVNQNFVDDRVLRVEWIFQENFNNTQFDGEHMYINIINIYI